MADNPPAAYDEMADVSEEMHQPATAAGGVPQLLYARAVKA